MANDSNKEKEPSNKEKNEKSKDEKKSNDTKDKDGDVKNQDKEDKNEEVKEEDVIQDSMEEDSKEGNVENPEAVKEEENLDDVTSTKADNVIEDIMAQEEHNEMEKQEELHKKFKKREILKQKTYSIGNIDEYFHEKYSNINIIFRYAIEMAIVLILFMSWSILLSLICRDPNTYPIFKTLTSDKKINETAEFIRESFFVSLVYIIFVSVTLFIDNLLYIVVYFLTIFGVEVVGIVAELLHILRRSRHHLKNSIVAYLVFVMANFVLANYKFFAQKKDFTYIFLTGIFWFGCLSAILFAESFLMNILTSELRNKSFKGRIWDANYKTFIFKKLAAIAEATPYGKHNVNVIISKMNVDYDTGFYLKHNELDLSEPGAVVESILGYLEVDQLESEDIKRFFPNNSDEVINYLYGSVPESECVSISYEVLKKRAEDLYQERTDIMRSLYDRDNILRKLNLILTTLGFSLSIIIFMILLNLNYKVYLASIGPFIFGFGWIFQDSIKEIYRCFVFLLINHPFDCGDRIILDNEELTVLRIDLLYSTFVNINGRVTYIPNGAMFLKKIDNVRRSDLQAEDIIIRVDISTKYSQIIELKTQVAEYLNKNAKDFTGKIFLKNCEPEETNLKIILSIEHNSNFQDPFPKYVRREGFIENLEKCVIMRSEMHEEPTPPLREEKREEDGAKNFKPKNKALFISQGGTTLEEPTNNINEESYLEEETKVVEEVEENI
ncbi:mechanosensitive ion channel protein [Hamiltosporidium tvaerminnensis]|uniref:Mechanosensitive ion channel protein n=1 Tax=Hamiltosporidium tvaerminnensis TaxID=1176355 RepID=A0A4Q9L8N4_9MICR|nr:mechanosensitive ion channel protein [Hamiltosporidium tvaerminnensis]